MHPQIRQNKPGRCPICGMDLVPLKAGPQSSNSETDKLNHSESEHKTLSNNSEQVWTCPMHPEIKQDKPGRCPKCGMDLEPSKLSPPSTSNMNGDSESANKKTAKTSVYLMPAQSSIASITTEKPQRQSLTKEIQLFGEIKYIQSNHIDLTSFYPGRVERVLVSYNAVDVKEGEPLLVLYSEEAIADQERYLQAIRTRYLTTFYERKVADAQVETYKVKLLKSGFTEEELNDLVKHKKVNPYVTVRAYRNGTLVGKLPHVGERVSNEEILFHIVPLENVWFTAQIFEQDLGALKLGQKIQIIAKAFPETKFEGELVYLSPFIDPANRTIMGRFTIPNPDKKLVPDMTATGMVQLPQSKEILTIPSSAVIDTGKRKIVYVKTTDDQYEQREVMTGSSGTDRTEVMEGLTENDFVVTTGAFLLDAEAQLKGSTSQSQHQH
jgi:Cu(I)/Ag(I) efflux system membrane fusion protein